MDKYINFYNNERPQRRFNKQTPIQVRLSALLNKDNITQYPVTKNNTLIKYFEKLNKRKEQYAII